MRQPAPRRLLDTRSTSTIGAQGKRRIGVEAAPLDAPRAVRSGPVRPSRAENDGLQSLPVRIAQGRLPDIAADPIDHLPPADPKTTDGIVDTGWLAFVVRRDENGRLHLAPAWPLWALLVAFPFWWALGLGSFIFPILAVPMAMELRRRRPLRLPPKFWLWAAFMVWTVLSLAMFRQDAPGTTAGTLSGRLISVGLATIEYVAITVTLLFVGNLNSTELPQRRLIRWLSVLFMVTVAGGFLGTYLPNFQFTSPIELLLPGSLRADPYIAALVHPNAAQVQSVLGTEGGRAAAPWGYTNFWANNVALLLIWFVVAWGIGTATRRRLVCVLVVATSIVPIVYSLNRGLWIGLIAAMLWVAIRLFLRGKVIALFAVLAIGSLGVIAFAETPLHEVLGSRLDHPGSNDIRAFLSTAAIDGANRSPVLGWGGTRKTIGSYQSIAIGKTPSCPQCGQFTVGSNGQFWTLIFNYGWVGAGFFYAFLGMTIWTFRRERSLIAQGGIVVVGLTILYTPFYISLPSGLTITMISIGLMWRSRLDRAATL